jgi:hypothetical protein
MKLSEIFITYLCKIHGEVELFQHVAKYITDPMSWHPLGNDIGNARAFRNQHGNAPADLIEKVTNNVDAILELACRLLGIDPRSPEAPKTPEEAARLLCNYYADTLEEVQAINKGPKKQPNLHPNLYDNKQELLNVLGARRFYSRQIQITAAQSMYSHYPSLILLDEGIGQHTDRFPDTFLTTSGKNKTDIPFLQGQYGQGGTGAHNYCGNFGAVLIISMRHPVIAEMEGYPSSPVTATIIRKHPRTKDEEYLPTYLEYLKINGKIPSWEYREEDWKDLKLEIPWKGDVLTPPLAIYGSIGQTFRHGTWQKLFDYQIDYPSDIIRGPSKDTSRNTTSSLWEHLNHSYPNPILPYTLREPRRLMQSRNKTSEQSLYKDTLCVLGNIVRTKMDKLNKGHTVIKEGWIGDIGSLKIEVVIAGFNTVGMVDCDPSDDDGSVYLPPPSKRVSLLVGGQTHGYHQRGRDFIRRKLGFPLLADYMAIYVDISGIKPYVRESITMANRETLFETKQTLSIYDALIDTLKDHSELVKLEELYRSKRTKNTKTIDYSEFIENSSLNINNLLSEFMASKSSNRTKVFEVERRGNKTKRKPNAKPVVTSYFPTKFTIDLPVDPDLNLPNRGLSERSPKKSHGVDCYLFFKTDAENGYLFSRSPDEFQGVFNLSIVKIVNTYSQTVSTSNSNIHDFFVYSSPGDVYNGTLRARISPKESLHAGDRVFMRATLSTMVDASPSELSVDFCITILPPIVRTPSKTHSIPKKARNTPQVQLITNDCLDSCPKFIECPEMPVDIMIDANDKISLISVNMETSILKLFEAKLNHDVVLASILYQLECVMSTITNFNAFLEMNACDDLKERVEQFLEHSVRSNLEAFLIKHKESLRYKDNLSLIDDPQTGIDSNYQTNLTENTQSEPINDSDSPVLIN